jgi:uncharacterized SAM-binding protein YcdF (DUF218 family)
VLAAFVAAATAYLFVWPEKDQVPTDADAIVVLAGGGGHRLDEALRLFRRGVAPTLVISDGRAEGWEEANAWCAREGVLCFRPDPYSTRGEARWVSDEAERRGWDSVVVVTSIYHVRRSRFVFERCLGAHVAVTGARPGPEDFAVGVAWEWPKSVYYSGFTRGC